VSFFLIIQIPCDEKLNHIRNSKTKSLWRYFSSRHKTQPRPAYTKPNLCPEVLMETTRGTSKLHLSFGYAKGAMNAPEAPST